MSVTPVLPIRTTNMIKDWVYLANSKDHGDTLINKLKAWLRSQTTDSDTVFTRNKFSHEMLQVAIQLATYEIRDNLDHQIARLVKEAHKYKMEVLEADFYVTRDVDWNGMPEEEIDGMTDEACIAMLWKARDEVAWLVNEISRLEVYISVEKQAVAQGWEEGRNSVFWPQDRSLG